MKFLPLTPYPIRIPLHFLDFFVIILLLFRSLCLPHGTTPSLISFSFSFIELFLSSLTLSLPHLELYTHPNQYTVTTVTPSHSSCQFSFFPSSSVKPRNPASFPNEPRGLRGIFQPTLITTHCKIGINLFLSS